MHGLAAADKVLNSFRKNKWTKLCLYSICYIICIDYKYENGNNCYIFNTVVHIYLQYIRVQFLLSVYHVLCRLFQHSVWGDQYSQSYQLHHFVQSVLMGISACFWSGGTITYVQLWISMGDEVFVPLICIYIWLDCTACAICHTTLSNDTPSNIFLYNHVILLS